MADPTTISVETLDELNGALAFVDRATSGSYVIKLTANIQEGTSVLLANGGTQLTYPDGLTDASGSNNATSLVDGVAQPIPVPPRQDLYALNLNSGVTVAIDGTSPAPGGANFTIDGRNSTVTAGGAITQGTTPTYRGLFVYAGQVTLSNLTIQNALARGGSGAGGGAGLGGGLLVAGMGNSNSTDKAESGAVVLSGVTFLDDAASGGGGTGAFTSGGGLGGGNNIYSSNGGGGVGGNGGSGNGKDGGSGIILGASGGGGGYYGGNGGSFGGGGGGAGAGGGVGGVDGNDSGDGGFGGGGGAFANGGFGGGGGNFGEGGFGGGGGGGNNPDGPNSGFGGGRAVSGGGGLGAGGGVFVQSGGSLEVEGALADTGGSVAGGYGGTSGQAFASGFYFQGTNGTTALTFDAQDSTGAATLQTVSDVVGDDTGSAAAAGYTAPNDYTPGSVGLVKTGVGTLNLTAANTYTGGTTITTGTLQLGDGKTTGSIVGGVVDGGVLAFDEAAATPLTFSGIISNNGGTAGALRQLGGTTVLSAKNTYSGGTTLNGGTLELAAQDAAGSANGGQTAGGVAFGAAGTTLQIDNAALTPTFQPVPLFRVLAATPPPSDTTEGSYDAPVTNFSSGKTLDLSGLTYAGNGATTASYDTTSHTLTVTDGPLTDTLTNFYLGSGLTDGYYTFATSQDANTTNGTDVTLSLNAPSAPVLAAGQDTGTSSTDGVTDINAPIFTGTADPNSTITLYDGNGTTAIGSGTSDANGNYTATVTAPLADGPHDITATVTDSGSDVSARSTATSITVDTVPPAITSVTETGNGIGANGNGDVPAGTVVTFTVQTDGPVYVTPASDGSTPTLTFTNGGVATYTGPTGTATSQLTFSYTVQKGQDTSALQLSDITGSTDVTDQAGNPIDLGSLMTASLPTGTLIVDTTPPTASSPTDTASQNSGPTPIGIAAPSDNLTAAGSLAIVAGTLPNDGRVTLADGTTPVVAGQALTAAQLTGLMFTPTQGLSNHGSTFTYTVTDGAGNATQGTAALNIGAAGAPTITGTHATADRAEAPVTPFSSVTVSDPNMGTNTLTITLQNGGGTLTGTGLVANPNGTYTLAGSAATVTQQLDSLSFTPAAPPPGTSATTTFVLSDVTAAGTSVTDVGTSVTDTAAASPPPPPPPPNPTPDTISVSPLVSYDHGAFTLTGTASSAAGVRSVEISAQVDGVATDLGAATVDANGNFSLKDAIGAHTQGFITATETDAAGGTAAATANYSLTGGLSGGKARQDRYSADGSAVTATNVFKADGSQKATVLEPGQTFTSSFFDTFHNGGAPNTTFVFNPGFGRDVVDLFRVDGADHDTLSFKGSDYSNDIATVLANARNTSAGLLITDPTASSPGGGPGTHDTLLLKGITKQQLAANQGDISFHA